MKSTSATVPALKEMLRLAEKRDALAKQISEIDSKMARMAAALGAPAPIPSRKAVSPAPASGRGALRQRILELLQSVGRRGISISEIAKALSSKPANIHAWFQATGKRIKQIKKVARGRYRLAGRVTESPARPAGAPKKSRKRGELKDKILATLKAAGANGITLKELSAKINAPAKNLSIWFATTGKKVPGVKKTGPGRYKLAA